jgi:hypothetical protein
MYPEMRTETMSPMQLAIARGVLDNGNDVSQSIVLGIALTNPDFDPTVLSRADQRQLWLKLRLPLQ